MIWFTSDLHFFHDRILEFHPKRKEIFGNTIEEAKEAMIQLWNSRVSKKDTVYILGDLAFGEVEDTGNVIAGNKVQDMDAIDLMSIIVTGVVLSLETYSSINKSRNKKE